MDVGSSCFGSIEPHRLVFLLIANDAEHVVKRSDTLGCKDRFPLDLIDAAFCSAASFGKALGSRHLSKPIYLKRASVMEAASHLVNVYRRYSTTRLVLKTDGPLCQKANV